MTGVFRNAPALVAVSLLLWSVTSALAYSPNVFQQYSSSLFGTNSLHLSFQKVWGAPVAESRPQESGAVSPILLPLSVSSFRTVSNPLMPKRVSAGVTGLDEDQHRKLETALLELLKDYERLMDHAEDGALKNNLAAAFNFFFLSSYSALKDGQELNATQQKSVLPQLNAAIAMALQRERLSDLDKQQVYESTVLAGSIIHELYNQGRTQHQPEKTKLARDMARELLERLMGLTPDKIHVESDRVWFE